LTDSEKHRYDNAIYIGKWEEYDVYEPGDDLEDIAFTGVPLVILVQGDYIRMSTPEEAYKQLDSMGK